MKWTLCLPAVALLAATCFTPGQAMVGAAGLALLAVAAVVFRLTDRDRPAATAVAWMSLPTAVPAIFALTGWPDKLWAGLFAFAFFLAGAVVGALARRRAEARRAAWATALLVAAALVAGDAAQPSPWWNVNEPVPIAWAPSLRWEIDRLSAYLGDPAIGATIPINGETLPLEKPAGEFRVIVLGSSPVIGAGIEANTDTFPKVAEALLRERFPGRAVRVVNAGIYGGEVAIWVYYRDLLSRAGADVVVLYSTVLEDDSNVPRRVWERLESILADLPPDRALRRRAVELGTGRRWLMPLKAALFATRTGRNQRFRLNERRFDPAFQFAPRAMTDANLAEARDLTARFVQQAQKDGAVLVLAPGASHGAFASNLTAEVFGRVADENAFVRFWDPRPLLPDENDFFGLVHPSARGHRRLGAGLADELAALVARR